MKCEHIFFVYGTISKPNVPQPYHNNFVFCCTKCAVVHMTVNNRPQDVMEFASLDDLGRFCLQSRYKGNAWPKES